jgi:uncharacterized membrane protein YkvA (DUF1232 family)
MNLKAEGAIMRRVVDSWQRWARRLKYEAYALYLAYRDPRVPWYARLFAAAVVAYAFSPLDLIPDFIPILGYLDDLLLVPLGIALAIKMIPAAVMADSRARAQAALAADRPRSWVAAAIVVAVWLLLAIGAIVLAASLFVR